MAIRTLEHDRTGVRVFYLLYKSELVVAKDLLVHDTGKPEYVWRKVVNRVDGNASTSEGKALHIPPLSPSQRENTLSRQKIQRVWVDTLLIHHNKALPRIVADLLLQCDDLVHLVVYRLSLSLQKLLTLFGVAVEESRLHFALLVFQPNVAGQDECIGNLLRHIWMPPSMVKHQTLHEPGLFASTVLHCHDFHHMQVERLAFPLDCEHRISDDL
mmetsp:Transcript_26934/g.104567  ORF Transcript_26934/g.104567 Transcript_26934/m.104567 type:complete len:214 (+) Transcript_26934:5211-5852(+)